MKKKIYVIGVGLIGGSFAIDMRKEKKNKGINKNKNKFFIMFEFNVSTI